MKIAYCGFDLFAGCLKQIIAMGHEVVKVFSCEVDEVFESSKAVRSLSSDNSIPFTYEIISTKDISYLENIGCDVLISAGYYYKIPLSQKIKQINIHPSLLPDGRGPWPMPWYFLKDYKKCGVSAHLITDALDEGDILLSDTVDIEEEDNLETLTYKLVLSAEKLVSQVLSDLPHYYENRVVQTEGTYWKEPGVKEKTFTPKTPYKTVDKITKAFYGFTCFYEIGSNTLKINKAKCVRELEEAPAGSDVRIIDGGYLCILKLT